MSEEEGRREEVDSVRLNAQFVIEMPRNRAECGGSNRLVVATGRRNERTDRETEPLKRK